MMQVFNELTFRKFKAIFQESSTKRKAIIGKGSRVQKVDLLNSLFVI